MPEGNVARPSSISGALPEIALEQKTIKEAMEEFWDKGPVVAPHNRAAWIDPTTGKQKYFNWNSSKWPRYRNIYSRKGKRYASSK